MIGVTLEVNGRVFQQFVDDLSVLPQRFIDVLQSEYVPAENLRWGGLLNQPPGPVRLPFEFGSEKSRRFYFANFDTPYQRTGATQKWKVEGRRVDANTYEVWLVNENPNAPFVYGPRQVAGHTTTGWPNVYLTLAAERGESATNAIALFASRFNIGGR